MFLTPHVGGLPASSLFCLDFSVDTGSVERFVRIWMLIREGCAPRILWFHDDRLDIVQEGSLFGRPVCQCQARPCVVQAETSAGQLARM